MRNQNFNERTGETPKPGEAPPQSNLQTQGKEKQPKRIFNEGQEFNGRPEPQ